MIVLVSYPVGHGTMYVVVIVVVICFGAQLDHDDVLVAIELGCH